MTDVYTDTEYSVTMLAVLAEHRGFAIRKMPLKFGTGGLKMTIDEAIEYYIEAATQRELADEETGDYDKWNETRFMTKKQSTQIIADDRQLAEWLRELVAYRKLRICGNCRHYVVGTTHFGECYVTSDIKPCVVRVHQTACDTFFDYKDLRNEVEKPKP